MSMPRQPVSLGGFDAPAQTELQPIRNIDTTRRVLLGLCCCLASMCGLKQIKAQVQPVKFQNASPELGLGAANNAACWVDLDNDGWVDVCAGGVWRNEKGKKFTKQADFSNCIAADFDNDGLADLFSWATLKLHRNLGGWRFEEVALPELPKTVSQGACWGDFDGDGFVDLFVGGYEDWNAGITWPFLVLMNVKGSSFRLAYSRKTFRGRGVTACDFDQDGDLDVYVSNYRLQPNSLWRNQGRTGFHDVAKKLGAEATSAGFAGGHSIGSCWGDFDNDGLFDLFAGNFAHVDNRGDQPKSRFLRNQGKDAGFQFEDKGPGGVHYQESYASPAAADFDNDGKLDLYFTTVYATASFGRKNHPVLFRNQGDFQVADVSAASGLGGLGATYQAAWADFDNDGDLDLLSDGKLWRNQASGRHWLRVRLKGDGKSVNQSAVGAQVRLRLNGKTLTRQVEAGTGQGNQNEPTLHFGLGENDQPVELEITWPNRQTQRLESAAVDKLHQVEFTPKK